MTGMVLYVSKRVKSEIRRLRRTTRDVGPAVRCQNEFVSQHADQPTRDTTGPSSGPVHVEPV